MENDNNAFTCCLAYGCLGLCSMIQVTRKKTYKRGYGSGTKEGAKEGREQAGEYAGEERKKKVQGWKQWSATIPAKQ